MRPLVRLLTILWASPYTLLGLTIGSIGLCTGGRAAVRDGVIQFHSGGVRWFVTHLPLGTSTLAITLGHTILGQTASTLEVSFNHELVHVRQYERWGPLMGPAYLLASAYLYLRGRSAYWDNPFEREAYEADGDLVAPPDLHDETAR